MYQKRRLRAIVISGYRIKKAVSVLLTVAGVFGALCLGMLTSKLPDCDFSGAKWIINCGLKNRECRVDLSSVMGFDIRDAKSIVFWYYSKFGSFEPVVEAVESAPVEVEKVPQFDIAEVNAAKGMALSNQSGKEISPEKLIAEPLHIDIKKDGPQILIVHTHTTESYTDSGKTKYSATDSDRSTDSEKNMVAVGKAMQEVFTKNGIESVHDVTVHDYPSYNGAYTRSLTTMKGNLSKHPSIKIVLDVHRDGITREDGTKVKVATDIDGEKVAQCMFVVGTDAKLSHKTWQDNMRLACKLQNYANTNFPGLMRPINVRSERFNQQITSGSLIIEVGSNGNTLSEAKLGAQYMAEVISAVLLEEQAK